MIYAVIFPSLCVGTHTLPIDDKAAHSIQRFVPYSWPPPTLKTISIFNSVKVTLVHTILPECVGGMPAVESFEIRGL